jgi:hypothetical protein
VRALALVFILSAGTAAASQKVTIAPVIGDKKQALEKQLEGALCQRVTCVPAGKVMAGHKPDFKKARRASVDAIVTGSVHGPKASVQVLLTSQPKTAAFDQPFHLVKGVLSKRDLSTVLDAVATSLGGVGAPGGTEPPPIETTPPAAETKPTPAEPTPEPKEEKFSERQHSADSASSSTSSSTTLEASAERPGGRAEWPFILADVGLDMVGRSFGYNNLTAGPALAYSAPFIASPRLDLEAYPLAHSFDGGAQRLGVTFEGAYAVGLQSQFGTNPPNLPHPTTLSRFDFGALCWLGKPNILFAPELGYRLFNFSTGEAKDGSSLTGLPNVSYGALRISGAVQGALTESFRLEARFSVLPVLSTGQLIGGPYFSKGSGFGFEGEAGARLQLLKNVGLAVFGEYTRYGFSFTSQTTDTYQAQGATDSIYGGRVAVTFNF